MKQLLSLQSAVLHGCVGNEAAALIYPALGLDIARIDTVKLAAHPGHQDAHPVRLEASELQALLSDFINLPAAHGVRALHSGYLASPDQGRVLAETLPQLQSKTADRLIYLLDPVLGDSGQFYVHETIADIMRESLMTKADIITPNGFELSVLSGVEVRDFTSAEKAAQLLLAAGPKICLATGLSDDIADPQKPVVDMLLVDGEKPQFFYNQHISDDRPSGGVSGAGDCLAALFLGLHLSGSSIQEAAQTASHITQTIMARAVDRRDMPLFDNRHLMTASQP